MTILLLSEEFNSFWLPFVVVLFFFFLSFLCCCVVLFFSLLFLTTCVQGFPYDMLYARQTGRFTFVWRRLDPLDSPQWWCDVSARRCSLPAPPVTVCSALHIWNHIQPIQTSTYTMHKHYVDWSQHCSPIGKKSGEKRWRTFHFHPNKLRTICDRPDQQQHCFQGSLQETAETGQSMYQLSKHYTILRTNRKGSLHVQVRVPYMISISRVPGQNGVSSTIYHAWDTPFW